MERNEILKLVGFSDEIIGHLEKHEKMIQNMPFIDEPHPLDNDYVTWTGDDSLIIQGNQNFSNALTIRTT
jgi:hypothetical protein